MSDELRVGFAQDLALIVDPVEIDGADAVGDRSIPMNQARAVRELRKGKISALDLGRQGVSLFGFVAGIEERDSVAGANHQMLPAPGAILQRDWNILDVLR